MDYEIPEIKLKLCTCLLLYVSSLASFVCGFSLPNPLVAYGREYEENSVCGNSGRHKGFSGQRLRIRKAESCKAFTIIVKYLETVDTKSFAGIESLG